MVAVDGEEVEVRVDGNTVGDSGEDVDDLDVRLVDSRGVVQTVIVDDREGGKWVDEVGDKGEDGGDLLVELSGVVPAVRVDSNEVRVDGISDGDEDEGSRGVRVDGILVGDRDEDVSDDCDDDGLGVLLVELKKVVPSEAVDDNEDEVNVEGILDDGDVNVRDDDLPLVELWYVVNEVFVDIDEMDEKVDFMEDGTKVEEGVDIILVGECIDIRFLSDVFFSCRSNI